MANRKDLATSTVLTAPSPATSGTSLVVQSGHGARFPDAPFYVTAYPDGAIPTLDNAEILYVSGKSTDTFTIERAQGDTSAQSIATDWRITNAIYITDIDAVYVPVGGVVAYAGTTAPDGWLLCYGQEVSRSTYAGLYSAIGDTYGNGDGSTTFNLPDLRGRVIAGQDDMGGSSANRLTDQTGGLDGDTLGDTGGAETNTLTPSNYNEYSWMSNQIGGKTLAVDQNLNSASTYGFKLHNTGQNDAVGNVQPTIILNYIIKALDPVDPNTLSLTTILEAVYPVGGIFISGVSTNPATLLGFGTWSQIEGKFIVGMDTGDGDFDLDDTGGAKTHTHEIEDNFSSGYSAANGWHYTNGGTVATGKRTSDAGSSLPPYIAKYIWQRTA